MNYKENKNELQRKKKWLNLMKTGSVINSLEDKNNGKKEETII